MYMYLLVPGKTMENSVAVMVSSYMYCGSTHTDLPTLPEFPGLSRKNDAYLLPRVFVQNSRARAEFVCAARCACNCA